MCIILMGFLDLQGLHEKWWVGLPNINFQGQADVSFREDAAFGYSNEPQPIGITRDLVGLNGSQFLLESSPQNGLQEVYVIIAETWQ